MATETIPDEADAQEERLFARRRIDETIKTRVQNAYDSAEQIRRNKMDDIRKARQAYNSEWAEARFTKEQAKRWFYVHLTFEQIQAMLSELLAIYMRLEKFAEVRPTIPWGEDVAAAEMMDHLLYIFWDIKTKPYGVLRPTFEAALRDGTSVVKAGWNKMTAPGPDGRPVPIINEGYAEHLPLENVLWDPTARKLDDIRWFIHEKEVPLGELWNLQAQGIYENVDKVQGNLNQSGFEVDRPTRADEVPTGLDVESQTVRIREYWGEMQLMPQDMLHRVRTSGEGSPPVENVVCTTTENNVILRRPEPNPYARLRPNMTPYEKLPFFIFAAMPKDNSVWGRSIALELKGAQREINKLRNQRRQNVDLAMGGKVLLNTTEGDVDRDRLMSPEFMGIVECQGRPEDLLNIFQPANVTQNMAAEEALVMEGVERITGVTRPFAGQALSKRQTRGEVQSLLERSSARIATIAEALNATGVTQLLEFYVNAIVKYVEPEEVAELLDYKVIPPPLTEILDRDYEITLRAGLRARARQLEVKDMEYALQVTAQILEPFPTARLDIGLDILEEMLPKLGAESGVKTIKQIREQLKAQRGPTPQGGPPGGQ